MLGLNNNAVILSDRQSSIPDLKEVLTIQVNVLNQEQDMPDREAVTQYYDTHTIGKLRQFIDPNPRVERAWQTIICWAPQAPTNILEVGCGIGDISWRMSQAWPETTVLGIDPSPVSIQIAKKLFAEHRCEYIEGFLTPGRLKKQFDLIVLMDVYEHISSSDRPILHESLRSIIKPDGRVILSFPTPRHLAWLVKNKPTEIQPVDEDVSFSSIGKLAQDLQLDVLLYQEVDIWHVGDYAHAVLGKRLSLDSIPRQSAEKGYWQRLRRKFFALRSRNASREERLRLVRERLRGGDLEKLHIDFK